MGSCFSSSHDIECDEGCVFSTHSLLAMGGFGEVWLVQEKGTGRKCAAKKLTPIDEETKVIIQRELRVHKLLGSEPFIAPVIAVCSDPYRSYIICPYYKQGNLFAELQKRKENYNFFTSQEVISLFSGVMSGICAIHRIGMAHRDIKTGNIMFTDDRTPVIIDFGSCREVPYAIENAQQRSTELDDAEQYCSLAYRAPELFSLEIGSEIKAAIDVWSAGCCLYALCNFESPFDPIYERGDSIALAVQAPERIKFIANSPHTDAIKDLVRRTLVVDPANRLTANETLEILQEMAANTS